MKILCPGDIILYRVRKSSSFVAKLIGLGEKILGEQKTPREYYHTALVDNDINCILEAVWPKTKKTYVGPHLSNEPEVEVYRVKGCSPQQINSTLIWAYQHLGERYDVGRLIFGWFPSKHAVICSTFVCDAWKNAGVKLVDEKDAVLSPDDISVSPKIVQI